MGDQMKKQSILITALSWILYYLGDGVSRLKRLWGPLGGPLYLVYNKLMTWSVDLDRAGKVWKFVEKGENPNLRD